MKIIKYGNDEGIVFNNGNSLWDTYSQSVVNTITQSGIN